MRALNYEVQDRSRLNNEAEDSKNVQDVADDQRQTLKPIKYLLEPPNLLLKPAEHRLDISLLAFGPPGGLQKLVVAVLERGDPRRHFLREFTYLVVVHRIVRWVGWKTKAIYQALFI